MARRLILALLTLLVAGCPAPNTAQEPRTDKEVKLVETTSRGLSILFKGPGSLSAGASIIASGALNFRVAASSDGFKPVAKATVQLYTLADSPVGKEATTDNQGVINYNHVPDGRTLSAVATFKVGDATYRLATLLPPGAPPERVLADPLSTMIDARVKKVGNRLENLTSPTFARIEKVRALCDKAGVTVATGELTSTTTLDQLDAVWTREVASKVTAEADKAEIKALVDAASAEARVR